MSNKQYEEWFRGVSPRFDAYVNCVKNEGYGQITMSAIVTEKAKDGVAASIMTSTSGLTGIELLHALAELSCKILTDLGLASVRSNERQKDDPLRPSDVDAILPALKTTANVFTSLVDCMMAKNTFEAVEGCGASQEQIARSIVGAMSDIVNNASSSKPSPSSPFSRPSSMSSRVDRGDDNNPLGALLLGGLLGSVLGRESHDEAHPHDRGSSDCGSSDCSSSDCGSSDCSSSDCGSSDCGSSD